MAKKKPAKPTPKKTQRGKGGYPTKYKPEYCQQVIDYMSEGRTFQAFAGFISVNRDTLYKWIEKHPEFAEAKKLAEDKCVQWWVNEAIRHANGLGPQVLEKEVHKTVFEKGQPHEVVERTYSTPKGATTMVIFALKNIAKWRDRHDVQHSGSMTLEKMVGGSMGAKDGKSNDHD